MTVSALIAYIGVVVLASISPGPDVALVVRNSLRHGTAGGVRTGLGIATGLLGWGLVSAIGITAVLAASAVAFTVLKIAGAAYLCYLGVRLLWNAWRGDWSPESEEPPDGRLPAAPADRPAEDGRVAVTNRTLFTQGLVTNLLNPKVAAFFMALLPQFITAKGLVAAPIIMGLATINGIGAVAVMSTYAVVAGRVTRFISGRRVERILDVTVGLVLMVLGGKLAFTERP